MVDALLVVEEVRSILAEELVREFVVGEDLVLVGDVAEEFEVDDGLRAFVGDGVELLEVTR